MLPRVDIYDKIIDSMKRYHKSKLIQPSDLYGMLGLEESGRQAPLESLKMWQSFDVDEFLELLNRKEPSRPMAPQSISESGKGLLGSILMAGPSKAEILRGWVDEWLDSGRAGDGDEPRRRNFDAAAKVKVEAYEYSGRGKIRLLGYGDTLEPAISKYETAASGTLRRLGGPSAEDYARELLVFFLLSHVRFSLAQCRNDECGVYFLLDKWNRLYPHGTLCDDCKRKRSQQSAIKATALEREWVRKALHGAAARRFRKEISGNPLWHSKETLKTKIAEFLTAKFGEDKSFCAAYPKGITGKWVANVKNWKPIEAAAKGGK